MTILFLIIILLQGEVRYRIEETPNLTECRARKAEVEAWVASQNARVIRSECFDVGQVVSK